MKKIESKLSLMFIGCAAALIAGCRDIDFGAVSHVREDGSIERTMTFDADEEADKEEILSRYELPEGGQWTEDPVNKFVGQEYEAEVSFHYRIEQLIPQARQPATDFTA